MQFLKELKYFKMNKCSKYEHTFYTFPAVLRAECKRDTK